MEKKAAEDGIELVGRPSPVGGYFADIGETEGIELAYDELTRYEELKQELNDALTPEHDLEWVELETNLKYDKPGEAFQMRHIVYDDPGEAPLSRFIQYDEKGDAFLMRHISYDEPGEVLTKHIQYDDKPNYAGDNFINKSKKNWKYIEESK